jgi:hypothetical protein
MEAGVGRAQGLHIALGPARVLAPAHGLGAVLGPWAGPCWAALTTAAVVTRVLVPPVRPAGGPH